MFGVFFHWQGAQCQLLHTPEFRLSQGKPGDSTQMCGALAKQQSIHWLMSLCGPLQRKCNSTLASSFLLVQVGLERLWHGCRLCSCPVPMQRRGPVPQHPPQQTSPLGHWPGTQITQCRGTHVLLLPGNMSLLAGLQSVSELRIYRCAAPRAGLREGKPGHFASPCRATLLQAGAPLQLGEM